MPHNISSSKNEDDIGALFPYKIGYQRESLFQSNWEKVIIKAVITNAFSLILVKS